MSLLKVSKVAHILEKFATVDIIHYEIDSACALKHIVHRYNKWVVHLKHY